MRDPHDLADPARHLASIWRALADATRSPESALRTPTLATVGLDGSAQARTIVIRSADAPKRGLVLYTDVRSPKVAELLTEPRAALSFWDATTQVQLRATGRCVRQQEVAATREAWTHVPESNRVNYRTMLAPGAAIDAATAVHHSVADGSANFAVLIFIVEAFDWLWLDRAGHKRARFDLNAAPALRQWLVP
jgi:pyridoxamine 5'-phosphate oxidase